MTTTSSCLLRQSLAISADKHSRGLVVPLTSLKTQAGVVLVVSLIILLLLTIIGLSAMQTTALEEKMAGNLRDKSLAFQAAESALRAAEDSLPNILQSAYIPACTNGFCSEIPTISLTDAAILIDDFWIKNQLPTLWVATSSVTTLGNNIPAPLYFIQRLGVVCPLPCSTPQYFKITVRATGGRTNTVVILQAIKPI